MKTSICLNTRVLQCSVSLSTPNPEFTQTAQRSNKATLTQTHTVKIINHSLLKRVEVKPVRLWIISLLFFSFGFFFFFARCFQNFSDQQSFVVWVLLVSLWNIKMSFLVFMSEKSRVCLFNQSYFAKHFIHKCKRKHFSWTLKILYASVFWFF